MNVNDGGIAMNTFDFMSARCEMEARITREISNFERITYNRVRSIAFLRRYVDKNPNNTEVIDVHARVESPVKGVIDA